MDMSIMTFNLRIEMKEHDTNHLWSDRRALVTDVVNRYQPLVFGTQEGLYPMIEYMAEQLPEYAWLGYGRHGEHEEEHNAIFYMKNKLHVVEWGQFWLSEAPEGPNIKSWGSSHHRICTWAHFQLTEQPHKEFLFYNTHLDHHSELAREKGIQLLTQRLKTHVESTGLPVILTGDLNTESDQPVIHYLRGKQSLDGNSLHLLTDCYSVMDEEPGKTIHFFEGGVEGKPIDYIFVSSEFIPQSTTVIRDCYEGTFPSDHYPVLAHIALK